MSRISVSRTALQISSRSSGCISSRVIESPCRKLTLLRTLTPQYPSQATRSLSISAPLHKKAGKANKAHARTDSTPPVTNPGAPTPTDIAYDVSGLENQILKAIEELTHELRQLRSSGKVSNEVVEAIKVQLGTKGGPDGHKETVKMGDIAQVFSRGRIMNVVVGEESYIKPVMSAIAASSHSLTPATPEPSNPLTIQIPLPPPTGESRRAAIEDAAKATERADKSVQSARQEHNKRLRKFELNRDVLPDDLQKAKKRMEEVIKKGHAEIKRISDGAKKVLEDQ